MPDVIFNYADFSNEKSAVRFPINDLVNAAALQTDVEAVTNASLQSRTEIADVVSVSSVPAASQWSQVELGLRIHVSDSVNNETGYFTIPSPDLDALTLDADEVELADAGVMAALVTEIETNVLSRDGNAVTVTRAEIVGRAR